MSISTTKAAASWSKVDIFSITSKVPIKYSLARYCLYCEKIGYFYHITNLCLQMF